MARLGIDFGTTNTVVTIHDRGLFSVVLHEAQTHSGRIVQEVFPSAILVDRSTGQRWFGLEAERRFAQVGSSSGYLYVPSLKRQLRHYVAGRTVSTDGSDDPQSADSLDLAEVLTDFLKALADSIRQSQSLAADEPLETVITWPANANGAQRHITRRCFRYAGFRVIDT